MTDTSRPQVRAWQWGNGYHAHFRRPGGGWQFVREKGGTKPAIYPTSEAAKDAAREMVFDFLCPPIVSDRSEKADPVAARLVDEVAVFRERRAAEAARLRNETFVMHRAGKRSVVVETKGRARA